MSVRCECCVLSGAGFCDGPISLPEKSNQVCVCLTKCYQVQQELSTPTVNMQKRSD